jgi:tetratricopeptide (TPR) repeat protein
VLKRLIQALAGSCGYAIRNLEAEAERADRVARQHAESEARLRADLEGRLRQSQVELEVARRNHLDALAQLSQTRKTESARAAGPPALAGQPPGADLDAQAHVAGARALLAAGDEEGALARYALALDLIHGYGPARSDLAGFSARYCLEAAALQCAGSAAAAARKLVKAVEFNPGNREARQRLEAILQEQNRRDVTRQCFIYHDPQRGSQVYRETFLRALEYVAAAGIVGDVLEFGTLGGFTARIISETMRDLFIFKRLHLFDSFEGLPEYTSPVDANSYDVAGRKVWADKMRFSDSFIEELREPIDAHIYSRLCEVISPERIFIYRGYFEDTLRRPLPLKAALVHVDCDLYQSTKEVLTRLDEMGALQDGCVLLFDDYNCFKASPHAGERRAFREFLDGQDRFESSPFFTYGFNGAAFFLHEKEAGAQARAA